MGNQRLKNIITTQRLQLLEVEKFLDKLWLDAELSKLFRTDLTNVRCAICDIKYDCSLVGDPNECLRVFDESTSSKKETGVK